MTTILKLGGSVITDKDRPETVDEAALDRASTVLGERGGEDLVVVHGGGSFGHVHAQRHGVSATEGTDDGRAITEIHDAMTDLNRRVIDSLQAERLNAVPVRPLSVAYRRDGVQIPVGAVETMLAEGFVPVLHGDVVVEARAGATVLSGDDIVVSLARSLGADRVGLCSTVPGVLDTEGEVIDRIEDFSAVADLLGESEATDVTGGMAGKVQALLELSTPAAIFGLEALSAFLAGERPGTTIDRQNTSP